MRTCRVLLVLTFAPWPFAAAQAQGTDRAALIAYVDSATSLMQRYSIRREKVNWPSLRSAAHAMIETAARPDSTTAWMAVRVAIAHLGDHHSHLHDPAAVRRSRSGDPSIAPPNPDAEVRLLTGAIGYVRIPGYVGSDAALARRYVVSLHDRIGAIAGQVRCGWVVDLRGNTGGSMWPMLSGIGPVLGDGVAGHFIAPGTSVPWGYGEESAGSGSPSELEAAALATLAPPPWVGVLTSRMTGSSGEAITIAFRERPHTRSFGAPTAGLTTSNGNFDLPDGSVLALATSIMADRTGHPYEGPVVPDSVMSSTEALAAATAWLQSSACPS